MTRDHAVLVANAPLRWTPRLTALATGAEPLLAADGGANHLARIGLRPLLVIGDLDSITQATRDWIGEDRLVHRPNQDRTDLDKALEHAFDEVRVHQLTVLGALGGRPDHDQGNLGLLARLGLGERLVFVGDDFRVLAISGQAGLSAETGETWSFWTYDPGVRVTIGGVRWPLKDAAIEAGGRPSISNEATSETVRISATGGSVLVYRQISSIDL